MSIFGGFLVRNFSGRENTKTTFSTVSFVDFEQVNVSLDNGNNNSNLISAHLSQSSLFKLYLKVLRS